MVTGRTNATIDVASDDVTDNIEKQGYSNWTTVNDLEIFPAGKTFKKLVPSLYEPSLCHNRGFFLKKIPLKTEGLLKFPETNSLQVIDEIKCFWNKEEKYREYDLTYKRGILLYGPPGSGKSCTIQLVLQDVLERGGVALKFENPEFFLPCVRFFREIQPKTPLIALMEDIDSILEEHSETEVLNILDGLEQVENTVFLATTNYPEKLGDRIVNRPSRFDRSFQMAHPQEASRKIYFEHLFSKIEKDRDIKVDIDEWVVETEGMSIAHLKELFVAVMILDMPYQKAKETLIEMMENKPTSQDDNADFGSGMGFHSLKKSEKKKAARRVPSSESRGTIRPQRKEQVNVCIQSRG